VDKHSAKKLVLSLFLSAYRRAAAVWLYLKIFFPQNVWIAGSPSIYPTDKCSLVSFLAPSFTALQGLHIGLYLLFLIFYQFFMCFGWILVVISMVSSGGKVCFMQIHVHLCVSHKTRGFL